VTSKEEVEHQNIRSLPATKAMMPIDSINKVLLYTIVVPRYLGRRKMEDDQGPNDRR
jgi:hypothetical protein